MDIFLQPETAIKIKEFILENRLKVKIFDTTFRYFGGYFTVQLKLMSAVTVMEEYFDVQEEFINAKKLLGEYQYYERNIERRGVFEKDLDNVKAELMSFFEENSIPYLKSPNFLKKFILKRYKEMLRREEIKRLRDKVIE